MTESRPDRSAPPEPTVDEPDTTTHPVSREHGHPGGANGEATPAANGHADDVSPRLPPPWERVPDAPAAPAPVVSVADRSTAGTGTASDPGRTSGHPDATDTGSGTDGWRGSDARPGSSTDIPVGRGVADLGEARTVGVDPRLGAGLGGLGDGLGSGTPAAAAPSVSGAVSGTPGGFPAAWPRNRRPRQANLQLKRLDPWSVLKIALVLSVVLYLVWMVAVGVLYGALDGIGVWERLNGQYADLVAEHAGERLISAGRIFGFAAVVGAVNSLLVAVAFSVSAFIYNVSADMVGGIEVTLSERD